MIVVLQTSNGSPLRKAMTPAQIEQASSGTSVPPKEPQAPQRGEAILLTIVFLLVLALVIRLLIRRQPERNANPAAMSAETAYTNLSNPGSPLP